MATKKSSLARMRNISWYATARVYISIAILRLPWRVLAVVAAHHADPLKRSVELALRRGHRKAEDVMRSSMVPA
jgi:hypothetical protein